MRDHRPTTQDHNQSNKASSSRSIAVVVIVTLCLITAGVLFFNSRPSTESNSLPYPSTTPPKPKPESGTYLKLSVTPDLEGADPEQQTELCTEILRRGFEKAHFPISVTPTHNSIDLHLGSTDPADIRLVKDYLTRTGKLSIHVVHRETRTLAADVASGNNIIPGYIALPHIVKDPALGKSATDYILIRRRAAVTGKHVKDAYISESAYIDGEDSFIINIELTQAGGDIMEAFTLTLTKNVDMIATVFDGKIMNYATLNADSLSRHFIITGLDSRREAENLIFSLKWPLTSTLKVTEQRAYTK